MKKILVPLNLRSDYQNVLNYAQSIAEKSEAEILFFLSGPKRAMKKTGTWRMGSIEEVGAVLDLMRSKQLRTGLRPLLETMAQIGANFSLRFEPGNWTNELISLSKNEDFDLMIVGTDANNGFRRYLRLSWISRLLGAVRMPIFILPPKSPFNEIQHITYAVDLTDYDATVVNQIKSIATLFDAKLTIAHVNVEESEMPDQYVSTLDQTISNTLDYPKINYRFFDHADPFGGIKNLVHLNNTQVLALINRKQFSWRKLFRSNSMTKKMATELKVPVLAFRKK
ncbi:MAG: universal stress protein [Bacteroidia bacterium]|nr:universal stress protein [Bacteroidia bacterium]